MEEQWLPVVGYEGSYSVSNKGRVLSHSRVIYRPSGAVRIRERILRPYAKPNKRGNQIYRNVRLSVGCNVELFKVCILVATAFHGPCPKGYICRHLDGNGLNDYASNLKWGTLQENTDDCFAHGTFIYGGKAYWSKLTLAQAREILHSTHVPASKLAERFGVSRAAVRLIWKGQNWKRALSEINDDLEPNLVR